MSTNSEPSPVPIEMRLRDVRQLFNSFDATPFPDRDLDADAEEFIVSWAMELPHDVPITLILHLSQPPTDAVLKEDLEEAIHNYFAYRTEILGRQFRNILRTGRMSLWVGLTCLFISVTGAELIGHFEKYPFVPILKEGFIIGGWVAMWRPIHTFLYDWWPLKHKRKVHERLSHATIEVTVSQPSTLASAPPPAPASH